MWQMKKEICFNVNQSFQTTMYRIVAYSILIYVTYLLYYLPPTEKNLNFKVLLQKGEHLLEICCHMNKGICLS